MNNETQRKSPHKLFKKQILLAVFLTFFLVGGVGAAIYSNANNRDTKKEQINQTVKFNVDENRNAKGKEGESLPLTPPPAPKGNKAITRACDLFDKTQADSLVGRDAKMSEQQTAPTMQGLFTSSCQYSNTQTTAFVRVYTYKDSGEAAKAAPGLDKEGGQTTTKDKFIVLAKVFRAGTIQNDTTKTLLDSITGKL